MAVYDWNDVSDDGDGDDDYDDGDCDVSDHVVEACLCSPLSGSLCCCCRP